jgi:hypothetical protein
MMLASIPLGFYASKHWLPLKWAPLASLLGAVLVLRVIGELSKVLAATLDVSLDGVRISSPLGQLTIKADQIEELRWEQGLMKVKYRGKWTNIRARRSDANLLDRAFTILKEAQRSQGRSPAAP